VASVTAICLPPGVAPEMTMIRASPAEPDARTRMRRRAIVGSPRPAFHGPMATATESKVHCRTRPAT